MQATVAAALERAATWDVGFVALAVVDRERTMATFGDQERVAEWASVTKLVTALAVLRAVDAGTMALDEPLGPPGSTVRHLLAHASGLGAEGEVPLSPPERTRIYANASYDLLGATLAGRAGRPLADVLDEEVLRPLGMSRSRLVGRAAAGIEGPAADLGRLGRELLRPTLLEPATFGLATSVTFPGLAGVLPGVGRFDPLDWGLGFELRDGKAPHWTGTGNSPATFGHFGASGAFVWADPDAGVALACVTDRRYGPWALEAWPVLSDAVLAALAADSEAG